MAKRPLIREVQSDSELLEVLRITAAAFKEEVAGAGMTFTQWVDLEYSYIIEDKISWKHIGKAMFIIVWPREEASLWSILTLYPVIGALQMGWPANDRGNGYYNNTQILQPALSLDDVLYTDVWRDKNK
jgi:hypothetical protein